MTLTDVLIVYLAFGAPLAVYKYLQNRAVATWRRIVTSLVTFFFWVPAAFQIGYLYLANAYSEDGFVSPRNSDAKEKRTSDLRELMTAELIRLARSSNLHDTRETVERYAGLGNAVSSSSLELRRPSALFEAAGREKYDLSQRCLMRRNLHRLERHHIHARRDFVALLDQVSRRFGEFGVIEMGIDLARQLDDRETVEQLNALKLKRGEVWDSAQQQHQSPTITQPPAVAMTASLNND